MTITCRLLAVVLLMLLCACNDGRAQTDPPGDDTAPLESDDNPAPLILADGATQPEGTGAGEQTTVTHEFPAAAHPAGQLYRVKWSAELADRSSDYVQIYNADCNVAHRSIRASEVFNSKGESVWTYPGERVQGQEGAGVFFRDDGSFYQITRHTADYKPDKPYIEVACHGVDRARRWSIMLTKSQLNEHQFYILPDGFLTCGVGTEKLGLNELRQYKLTTKFDLDGNEVWSREEDQPRNTYGSGYYNLQPMADGTFRDARDGSLVAYNGKLEELWTYTAYGARRHIMCFPDGNAFVLLKAPERLVKIGPDGETVWSCNISEHATGHINDMFDSGYAYGSYLTVGPDGTVYFCDAYGSLTAVSADGEYLWSLQDPRREDGEGDDRFYIMEYLEAPVVAPDGTIYLKSDLGHLMAVSPAGELLWVDKRFAAISEQAAVSPDGTVYVCSGGWIYALDPSQPARQDTLAEQEAIIQAEREEQARWEAEWAADRAAMEEELARVEAEGGDPDEYIAEMYGFGEPDISPDPDGPYLADRTAVADIILPALKDYYQRHKEYPPFLRGRKHEDDPLIQGGFLQAYPLMWPQPGCHCGEYHDWSGHTFSRWGCTTPVPGETNSGAGQYEYIERGCDHHGGTTADNYFGYARGDRLGAGTGEAWLWFYGSNIWPEQNNPIPEDFSTMRAEEYFDLFNSFHEFGPLGLDLLNAETGELAPDGKPDGICLLYRMKDGELVEVTRAEGI